MVKIDVVFADPKEITDDEMSRLVDDEVVHYEIIDGGSLRGIPKMAKLKSLTAAKKTPFAVVYNPDKSIKRVYYREEHQKPIAKMLRNIEFEKYRRTGFYEGIPRNYNDEFFKQRIMELEVNIKKLDERAVLPKYETEGAACMDLVPVSVEYKEDIDCWVYHSGLSFEIPVGFFMSIQPRSSSRKCDAYMPNTPGIVDSDFRGEVFACYKNRDPNNKKLPFELNGKGVAQIMILPYPRIIWREVDKLTDTERGVGGFGSTDKKS